ncbi:MAG: hypothetical protein WCH85_00700 [Methanomicrobiales archaeon]
MDIPHRITSKCDELDIPLVGFASAKSWDTPPFEPWVPRSSGLRQSGRK